MIPIHISEGLWRFKIILVRSFILFSLLFTVHFSLSQKKDIYFPQEQLIINECETDINPSLCFYNNLESRINSFLSSKKVQKELLNFKKDTLEIGGHLVVDDLGKIIQEKSMLSFDSKKLKTKLDRQLQSILKNITISKVENRKPKPWISKHIFIFKYLLKKNSNTTTVKLTKNEVEYSGGAIEEVPIFPGCENLNDLEGRKCFQTKIEEHVINHFSYPEKAIKSGISGAVYIIFIINKEGNIENIRTRAPDELLDNEAIRIVKLLPKMTPGKVNGKPVKVPFSFPIYFKLQ